jgi:PEP-CTERM motif
MENSMAVTFRSALLPVALALTLGFGSTASADTLTEGFDNGVPEGWTINNLSNPPGSTSWYQGSTEVFDAYEGAADSYLAANYNSVDLFGPISTWLITPTGTYNNGDTLTFFTRTTSDSEWADNLEVRFSSVGGTNVGNDENSVGTFTTLLLSINPDEDPLGYPNDWTQYSVTLSGLSGPTSGAFAFRYIVSDGGAFGSGSNYIGIDSVSIAAVPEPGTYLMLGTGLGLLAFARKRKAKA